MDLLQLLGWLFSNGLVIPMANILVFLTKASFGSYGIAIIIFTLIMRAVTWPLTRQQLHSTRAMQAIQPRVSEIQKKYKDPKRRQEEQMKLYREAGINPLGCIWPMLVQMPVWFGLYQAIRLTLGSSPESLLSLSQKLYPWPYLQSAIPLEDHFLWMNMANPDPTMIMAILVGGTMWIQQRMTTPPQTGGDPQQQQMNSTMLIMMPLMFAFFTLQFPSGLALYWVATNIVSIVLQYFYIGPENVEWKRIFTFSMNPGAPPAAKQTDDTAKAQQDAGSEGPAETEVEKPAPRRRRRRRRGRRTRRR